MKVDILESSGFCGGVERAIRILEETIKENPNRQIYLLGEIVHNKTVNDKYLNMGVKIVSIDELDSIPDGEIVISSAHGISDKLKDRLKRFTHIDSTCPFVKKNESLIKSSKEKNIVFIGRKGHAETIAMTEDNPGIKLVDGESDLIGYSSLEEGIVYNQTTYSMEKLYNLHEIIKESCPRYRVLDTICETTRSNQNALSKKSDKYSCLIIVGDSHSNNAVSLFEMSPYERTYFIKDESEVSSLKLLENDSVLIIGSASTPKDTLRKVKSELLV